MFDKTKLISWCFYMFEDFIPLWKFKSAILNLCILNSHLSWCIRTTAALMQNISAAFIPGFTCVSFPLAFYCLSARRVFSLSSESQRGYFLLRMGLKLRLWPSCVCRCDYSLSLVCSSRRRVRGCGSVRKLWWSEIPKSNKYWRYERTAPLRLVCRHHCLTLAKTSVAW